MNPSQTNSLDALLAARAAHSPANAAIIALDKRPALTYAGLYAQVQAVQQRFTALGIGRSQRVAIVLPNGPEMATAFLSVASAAAAAPLNPAYTLDEFIFYLQDLQPQAVLLLAGQRGPARQAAERLALPVIELRPLPEGPTGAFDLLSEALPAPAEPLSPDQRGPLQPQDLALILHTSGTTARPKMAALSAANLCASAQHIRHTLALSEADRCLNVMPLFHIHGLMAALLASVAAGGSVVCSPGFSAERFFDWLAQARPSWYTAVPTMHQAILAQAPAHRPAIAAAPLRFLRSSSASLPPPVMAELEATFSAPVIEAYGMTEAAHQMASNPLPPLARKPGSVGLPAGPEITILDPAGQPMPAGQVGEVSIRGANVTTGYLGNPSATAKAFSNGWFLTGDQGYFDPDGYLFLTGRLKEMINRGGEKVMPREVDEVLMTHPAVALAVTFAVAHPTLGEDIAAAVVLRPGQPLESATLRGFVLERLAAHKAPSQIIIVDNIPKGPTGKLQRIGLADKLAAHLQPAFIAPAGPVESILADLWAQVLPERQTPLGALDNFFACGGDSLRAISLLARIQAAFALELAPGTIFRHPTIAEQAALIETALIDSITAGQTPDVNQGL